MSLGLSRSLSLSFSLCLVLSLSRALSLSLSLSFSVCLLAPPFLLKLLFQGRWVPTYIYIYIHTNTHLYTHNLCFSLFLSLSPSFYQSHCLRGAWFKGPWYVAVTFMYQDICIHICRYALFLQKSLFKGCWSHEHCRNVDATMYVHT
jgi:hypothetical protein